MADTQDDRRRVHFENVFKMHKKPSELTGWLLFLREGQVHNVPQEMWGPFIRNDMENYYQAWLRETLNMVQAKKEGKDYKIDYEAIWGKPYGSKS
jgi:hypothetical protein